MLIPGEESEFARQRLEEVRARDFDYVKSHLDSTMLVPNIDEKLNGLADLFPEGELVSTEIIGSSVYIEGSTWIGNFTFEYQFEVGWAVANFALKRDNGKTTVVGLNVHRTEASQRELTAFSLTNKSFVHYIVLLIAVVVPVFIVVTLFFCIKTPIPKRKWLWVLLVLLGFGAISINWTTGEYAMRLLSANLLGASAFAAGPHAPWVITAAFPLGAILFWIKRRRFIELAQAEKSMEPIADPPTD